MRRTLPAALATLVVLASVALLSSPAPLSAGAAPTSEPRPSAAAARWTWHTVYKDDFSGTTVSPAWSPYHGPYGSDPKNFAREDHFYLNGRGQLVLLMKYRRSGDDGAAWYTGGAMLQAQYGGRFQTIDIRYKVVSRGVRSYRNIPLRWVDDPLYKWYQGETNFNEGSSLDRVVTFLHYDLDGQVWKSYRVDMTKWHTWRFVHRPDRKVRVYLDGKLLWSYQGTRRTVPDAFRRVVLQQEVPVRNPPKSTKGSDRILIDYMRIRTSSKG
ncbi:MAG TPA: hypothetical protein VGD39_16230 [Nocardioides sp.]|jgi:hypothetical protein